MATFQQWNDELVACPFNKYHRVSKSRLPSHIARCKMDHPDVPKEICNYNAQHRTDPAEHHHHLVTCSDRARADHTYSDGSTIFRGMTSLPSSAPESDMPESSENWDDDINENGPGFDLKSKSLYFPQVTGLKPAEKKKIYKTLHSNPDATFYPTTGIRGNVEGCALNIGKAEELVLKELRQPRGDHLDPIFQTMKNKEAEQQRHIRKVSLGRGEGNPRIAANIYGSGLDPSSKESFGHLIRPGRGLGTGSTTSLRVGRSMMDDLPLFAHGQVEDVEVAVS